MITEDVSSVTWVIILVGTFIGMLMCGGEPTRDKLDATGMMFAFLFMTTLGNACFTTCYTFFKRDKIKSTV